MSDKKILTREEYERISNENMKLFSNLDKQIEKEREEEEVKLSKMTEDEQVEYLWQDENKLKVDAKEKFSSVKKMTSKKDGE